jgi:glc operon protein GlcG
MILLRKNYRGKEAGENGQRNQNSIFQKFNLRQSAILHRNKVAGACVRVYAVPMSKTLPLNAIAIIALFVPQLTPAQQAGRGAPPKQTMDVATAKKMVAAAEAAALAANAVVSIAVVDSNGDLVCFERMDRAQPRAVTSSQGKARAALLFGRPTKEVQEAIVAGKPLAVTITMPAAGGSELTPAQGGLPIIKDGKVVGGIGVGGSLPANDEKFSQAGIDSIGK